MTEETVRNFLTSINPIVLQVSILLTAILIPAWLSMTLALRIVNYARKEKDWDAVIGITGIFVVGISACAGSWIGNGLHGLMIAICVVSGIFGLGLFIGSVIAAEEKNNNNRK